MSHHPRGTIAGPGRHRWLALAALVCLLLPFLPPPQATAAPVDGAVRSFDAEPLGLPPTDCRVMGDVTVAEAAFGGASVGNRAMRVTDQSSTVYTRAWCDSPQSAEKSVSYRFSPAQINAGPYVAIQGAPGTSSNGVWRFTFNRAGDDIRIAAYDGSAFGTVGTVVDGAIPGQWVEVTINATSDRAELIVNGVRFETMLRNAASPTMGEIYFGSAGASAVGVDYYIDDLAVSGQLPATAFPDYVTEPDVIIASGEGEQEPYFPEIAHLADGRLVTVFYWSNEHSPGISGGEHGQIRWTESSDGGRTWSAARVVIDTPADDRDPQITQLRDGTVVLTWFQTEWEGYPDQPATITGTYVARSTDGGQTWSEPALVESAMTCGCGARSGAYELGWSAESGEVVELDNGDLLIPLYGTLPDSSLGHVSVVRSIDGGRTWPIENEVMIPTAPGQALSETELAVLPDNRVTAVSRPGHVSDSYDGGRTWTVATKVPWTMQAPDLLTLPDGKVLLTYGGQDYGSNEPVVGRLLRRGQAWTDTSPVLIYLSERNIDQGDPSSAVVSGSQLLTVSYDTNLGAIVGNFTSVRTYAVRPR
ncbi:sialidase family protein [Parenemella sanctibonifatiensis]|uniref:Sialidase domain-containing protein n=1 Tax=Parenemella sanctibonifatiensis TaxID=2016505 RepID=A0A255E9I2_9ACTN|nr:sialidase family protein [Parenemella sanctibonifatiensis]OYN88227.1 hypothetical protein CGZ92_04585 [Parenemella sanctibonifatiensis]